MLVQLQRNLCKISYITLKSSDRDQAMQNNSLMIWSRWMLAPYCSDMAYELGFGFFIKIMRDFAPVMCQQHDSSSVTICKRSGHDCDRWTKSVPRWSGKFPKEDFIPVFLPRSWSWVETRVFLRPEAESYRRLGDNHISSKETDRTNRSWCYCR